MVLKWLLSHGLEKKHQVSSSINRSQKTQITKNNERNRKRIVSNPRKEAVTTNSQWFTWWFSFEAVFLNIRKLLVLYLLLPQSEAVVERSFLCKKMIMTDKKTNLVSESLEALKRLSQKQIFLCWRSKLYYWNLAVLL